MTKKITFRSIVFFDFRFKYILNRFKNCGGYIVAPAASALVDIDKKKFYHKSLRFADAAILDSGFFCILLNLFSNVKVKKLSGYLFLKNLLESKELSNKKFFLIDPTIKEQKMNYNLLRKKNFLNQESYCAPIYNLSNFKDQKLLKKINLYKPDIIIINLGGGIQEPLGFYLKNNIRKKNSLILCTGAAIGFLTNIQAPINIFYDKLYLGWLVRLIHKPKNYFPRVVKSINLVDFFLKR